MVFVTGDTGQAVEQQAVYDCFVDGNHEGFVVEDANGYMVNL